MTPLQRYRNDLSRADFGHDAAQERAVHHLQQLYEELNRPEMEKSGLLGWFFKSPRGHEPVIGLYMWGGVGRGKTYLMDAFYECLTVPLKMRMHFHSFMRLIHGNLKQIKDAADPLQIVANDITREARVLCFDEFHVADITDAMLLGRLLEHLFQRGVTLVATSNEAPDDLYSGGLQRERFVPAIELIKRHTRVLHVDNGIDYRLRVLEHAEIYHCPLDDSAHSSLAASFRQLAPEAANHPGAIAILERRIATLAEADCVVWFEFQALCGGPRSAADYNEIAMIYHTVLLSNIPVLQAQRDDEARRFITLVDEFYDRNVKLIVSAAAQPEALYQGERLAKPFRRTVSRLAEMRTTQYLARRHLP